MHEILTLLPPNMKANGGLTYRLTLQAHDGHWRCGYFCAFDNIWRVHADAQTPELAVEDLAFNKLHVST